MVGAATRARRRPCTSLSTGTDPSYATHELTEAETADVQRTLRIVCPDNWTDVLVQLNMFRSQHHLFDQAEWAAADRVHAFQWWDTFGSTLPILKPIAVQLLARTVSASPCEFNWSVVSMHESQRRGKLHTASTNKEVNVAATYHLEQAIKTQDANGMIMPLPTLDEAIKKLVEDTADETPLSVVMSTDELYTETIRDNTTEIELDASSESDDELYQDWSSRLNKSVY